MKKLSFVASFLIALMILSVIPARQAEADPVVSFPTSSLVISSEAKAKTITRTFTITNDGNESLNSLSVERLEFSDPSDASIKYVLTGSTDRSNLIVDGTALITVKLTIPSDVPEVTEYTGMNIKIKGIGNVSNQAFEFLYPLELRIGPNRCEAGPIGDIEINDIDSPDDGDDFEIGDTIEIRVEVENNSDDDEDVVLKAVLYDMDDNNEIETEESDEINIDEDDKENFEIDMVIPNDEDIDEDNEYKLFLKVYVDGKERTFCDEDNLDIDIEVPSHKVIISDYSVTPSTLACGETFTARVDLTNVGSTDERVRFRVKESTMNINVVTDIFDLEQMGDDDETTQSLSVKIPTTAKAGNYLFELVAEMGSGNRESQFANIEVTCGASSSGSSTALSLPTYTIKVDQGSVLDLPVTITNTFADSRTFVIEANPVGGFASTDSKTITLDAGEEGTVTLSMNVDSSASTGTKTVMVALKDGSNIVSTKSAQVTIESESSPITGSSTTGLGNLFGSSRNATIFFVIVDVLLVLVAIYVIALIFRRRKKD